MTNTMIGRVERAVCISLGFEPEQYACDRHVKAMCSRVARAAIEAMREPTLDMIQLGGIAYQREKTVGASGMTIEAQIRTQFSRFDAGWKSAIDAALSEESSET